MHTLQNFQLLFWLLAPMSLFAQYNGGDGDGQDQSRTIQLDLSGEVVGIQPLYQGGRGDGFTFLAGNQFTVDGQTITILYGGGRGDGFDRRQATFTLNGQALAGLYSGGNGDGFDFNMASLSLDGQSIAGIYGGGNGDGFDRKTVALSLDGTSLAGLYSGGNGDGFDRFVFNGGLMGEQLTLYGGGNGDGFDHKQVSFSLNGQSLAGLFKGGEGDGFDTETYFGVVPLPLTLISFDAFPEQDFVLLKWQTEDEVATDYFIIEKTRDGFDFAEVGQTDAAGYSEPGERLYYEMEDHSPYQGVSFYRLITNDLDGAISYSHLVEVEYANATDWDFALFPNPNTGRHLGLRPNGVLTGPTLKLEVLDVNGRLLLSEEMPADGSDYQFTLRQKLSSGSYLIRATDAQGKTRAKLLLVY